MKKILVTGGAGFIGSYIVDLLIEKGDSEVYIFDNLDPQVHPNSDKPEYLNKDAVFIEGDVRNIDALAKAVRNMDQIYHMAAAVGVGQSMYKISKYVEVNTTGTANLLDILTNTKNHLEKLVVAGSMSSYGEGRYDCPLHGIVNPPLRTDEQMELGDWEVHCPECKAVMQPLLTDENKPRDCNSIYALTKKDQEEMVLLWGKAYDIPTTALRFFNVYGPRQSLSNPYTGVCAIFLSRLLNDQPPVVYEDGRQTRDFISVKDIARASYMAMNDDRANWEVFNVAGGNHISIKEIGDTLARILGKEIETEITNAFRKGDVRHCVADVTKIKKTIGFQPQIHFISGMQELAQWTQSQKATDGFKKAADELAAHGLVVKRTK